MKKLKAYLDGFGRGARTEFAGRIGVKPPYLSRILSGEKRPGPELMDKIAEATGGQVDWNAWSSAQ